MLPLPKRRGNASAPYKDTTMTNVKRDYIVLQTINMIFFLMSYSFARDYLQIEHDKSFEKMIVLFIIFFGALYVFYTNRIFYIMLKNNERSESE